MKKAIEAKMAATQHAERAENEKREAMAEAAKGVEIARGQAQAASPAAGQMTNITLMSRK